MKTLLVNQPTIDWITLTSWDLVAWDTYVSDDEYTAKTIEGYKGHKDKLNGVWVGTGKQKNFATGEMVAHRMLQISGASAEHFYPTLRANPVPDEKCTRLDIQVTTDWPGSDLFSVCRRWREKGRHGNYLESETGGTVYLGAWGSDRFIRVYQKTEKLVRFEVCYKKAYAIPSWNRFKQLKTEEQRKETMRRWLSYELLRVNDLALNEVFGGVLNSEGEKPPREERRATTDTERWIRRVVAPALSKYVHSHDVDEYLIVALLDILQGEKDVNYKLPE